MKNFFGLLVLYVAAGVAVYFITRYIQSKLGISTDDDGGSPVAYPSRPAGLSPSGGFIPGYVDTQVTNN